MTTFKAILILYRQIEVNLAELQPPGFVHTLTEDEILDAVESFQGFPVLVNQLTDGFVSIESEIVPAGRALTTLTSTGRRKFWPSPADTRAELNGLAPAGRYDSIFVLWPQTNLQTRRSIESDGWGLAIAASAWSNQATYATVANAPSAVWKVPRIGEVWLHEWLHGVCAFYAGQGYTMPSGDADGGARHGYEQSPESGWTEYYRDLMTGNVLEEGQRVGIPLEAWARRGVGRGAHDK